MKNFHLIAILVFCLFGLIGCSVSGDVPIDEGLFAQDGPTAVPEGVFVVEEYFRAVETGDGRAARALLSRLVSDYGSDRGIGRKDVDKKIDLEDATFIAVQSVHPDWFTFFVGGGYRLERVEVLNKNESRMEIRAHCTTPLGQTSRISHIVDVLLIWQDGRWLIRELSPRPGSNRETVQGRSM